MRYFWTRAVRMLCVVWPKRVTFCSPFRCKLGDEAEGVTGFFFGSGGARFMVFGIGVDLPEIVEFGVGEDVFDAEHRGHHGVVLVVIFVPPRPANQMEIRVTIFQLLTDDRDVIDRKSV